MDACIKCNNTNVTWNGIWKQCASCGEVHERQQEDIALSSQKNNNSLSDIVSLSFKSTFMGKLVSRLRLIS